MPEMSIKHMLVSCGPLLSNLEKWVANFSRSVVMKVSSLLYETKITLAIENFLDFSNVQNSLWLTDKVKFKLIKKYQPLAPLQISS